ncbi:MAG TPA: hypothetical protein VEP69_02375 [Thermodesulfovibrionales bacterium]|nr:hypothetical protein [Thermodesulfovibrionales bacterium]
MRTPAGLKRTRERRGEKMKLKIGVMGSASSKMTDRHKKMAYALGRAIALQDCITITGACPGFPLEAAQGAKEAGGLVVGISPGLSLWEHLRKYGSPAEYHDVLIFTGSGLMGREVVNIRSSDIVVIMGGRSGTLGEFSIAYDEGKLIGVLMGTGGITEEMKQIIKVIRKTTGSKVIYDSNPARLVRKLLVYYTKEHFRHPSCHHGRRMRREG